MKEDKNVGLSDEKFIRILLLSRIANRSELFPTYEPSEDDITEMCPAIKIANEVIFDIGQIEMCVNNVICN